MQFPPLRLPPEPPPLSAKLELEPPPEPLPTKPTLHHHCHLPFSTLSLHSLGTSNIPPEPHLIRGLSVVGAVTVGIAAVVLAIPSSSRSSSVSRPPTSSACELQKRTRPRPRALAEAAPLLVGDVVFDWHVELNPALGRPFRTFLDAHRNLEALHLQSHAPSVAAPGALADLHADALAKVSTFSGALVQAQVLPARVAQDPARAGCPCPREGTPLNVGASLAALPALASLTIAFRLEQGYDNGTVLRAIVAACPHLRHLDFTIACRPSFTIETFMRCVRPLGQLRTLALRIMLSGEDDLRTCGTRIVRASPH
ncbi:hypothetical protein BC826DRAFT_1183859 [Russula brevipes]|nr:hypothetical protein BC826DRAFT_1183859 [Russula brevipes]